MRWKKPILHFFLFATALMNPGGWAAESGFEAFFAHLELGELKEARQQLLSLPGAADPGVRAFLEAQVAFHAQEYGRAEELLKGAGAFIQANPAGRQFRDLVRATREKASGFTTRDEAKVSFRFAPGRDEVLALYGGEVLNRAIAAIGSDLGFQPEGQVVVEFYPSWEDFMSVSTLTEKEIRTSGTIALCKYNKMMLTTPRAMLRGYEWMDTLAHEFTHYAITRVTRNRAPVWLHEGIAKYEEQRWNREGGSELLRRSQALLKRRMEQGKLIPFDALHPSIAKLPSAEDAEVAFAQVYFFVRYLVEKKGGMENIRAVLRLIRDGQEARAALAHAYGASFDSLYDQWLVWLKAFPLARDPEAKAQSIALRNAEEARGTPADEEPDDVADERARQWIRLGDLLREKGRAKAAFQEYDRALGRLRSPSPVILNRIAVTALATGNRSMALEMLTRAAEVAPEYPATFVRRGKIYLEEKEWTKAEADFSRANEVNPFNPDVQAGLKLAYDKLGKSALRDRAAAALRLLRR